MVRIAINGDSRVLAEMAVQMWDSHRVFIARILKRTINVIIKGMGY